MQLVKPESASHFYQCIDGVWKSCYQVERKDGNGMKPFTLREARTSNPPAVPSVTTFLQILDKPELDRWKQEKAIHAALTLPRKDGESEDDFAVRVVEDMEAESEKAIHFGQDIHAAIESYLAGEPLAEDSPMWPWLKDFVSWAKDEITSVLASEQIVGIAIDGLAYAGRMDLLCRLKSYPGISLCDFKSQKIKKDAKGIKKPVFYPEWILQLCAYAATQTIEKIICKNVLGVSSPNTLFRVDNFISVVIDSSEPGPVFVKRWEDSTAYWHAVRNAYDLWCFMKGYTPTMKQSQPES